MKRNCNKISEIHYNMVQEQDDYNFKKNYIK